MDLFIAKPDDGDSGGYEDRLGINDQRDTSIQIGLSVILGVGAFFAFCYLRPRWPGLYAARKKQKDQATSLPDLPDSYFGWIPAIWKITEQQVLASAGLDAYVFLRFFKVATKTLSVTLFFALVVIKPVHDAFPDNRDALRRNGTRHDNSTISTFQLPSDLSMRRNDSDLWYGDGVYKHMQTDYLWMYLVFAYVFTGLAMYLLITETQRIIAIRQEYLGSQATVTDRTIRLSGIPKSLRSEEKIKNFIEHLQIGKVDKVMLCRNWRVLDAKMAERMDILRKLEEAWTVFLGRRRVERTLESLPIVQPPPPGPGLYHDDEGDGTERHMNGGSEAPIVPYSRDRPTVSISSGWLKMRTSRVDAIDHYEEKLKQIDEEIKELRRGEYEPTSLAFVTLDSVAACQMAAQAVLDPSPMHLIARQSPAPSDVVWSNTYLPRSSRMTRAWMITVVITVLTIFWSLLLVPLATVLNLEAIHRVWPELADAIDAHPIAKSLVQTQLPTLLSSLLFVAVPYLYDWLANMQGMESQADVDLSVISKNFFFLFFNYFIIFTVLGTFSKFYEFFQHFQDSLKDTTRIAFTLALSLQRLMSFYTNLIILQGIGLFPFRLLEIGSVILYPIYRIGAKTPRDYAELVQPPTFYYGFYLPQVILIFIICLVYSVLRESWKVLLSGLLYFVIGGFVYKYQLLYAMDHRQHSTGRAWMMISHRIVVGVLLFQITTAGQLALKGAVRRAILVVPLIIATVCFGYAYNRSYTPLMRFISLASIERRIPEETESRFLDPDGWGEEATSRGRNTDDLDALIETKEDELPFVNPNLVSPLEDVWISDKAARQPQQNEDRYRDEED